jgi:hypothetical protein
MLFLRVEPLSRHKNWDTSLPLRAMALLGFAFQCHKGRFVF